MDKDRDRGDKRGIGGIWDTVEQNQGLDQLDCWLPLLVEKCLVDLLVAPPHLRSNHRSRIQCNHSNLDHLI